jgi:hypothetical protein
MNTQASALRFFIYRHARPCRPCPSVGPQALSAEATAGLYAGSGRPADRGRARSRSQAQGRAQRRLRRRSSSQFLPVAMRSRADGIAVRGVSAARERRGPLCRLQRTTPHRSRPRGRHHA